jgi:Cu+-exporting ATPase
MNGVLINPTMAETEPKGSGSLSADGRAVSCHHCGLPCPDSRFALGEKAFCCGGCRTVFEILRENGLEQFYQMEGASGARAEAVAPGQFQYLDEPEVRARLVDFSDGKTARVRFVLPAIHCIACVWLLENLFKLHPGIVSSRVNFPRKEISLTFDPSAAKLGELAALLASLGYPPELKLSDLEKPRTDPARRRLHLQIGVAGFAFGNTMLFALSGYFGLDAFHGPAFRSLFGWLGLALALPVVAFSAADYWKGAWTGLRHRRLTLDVPIVLGVAALFLQSVWDVASGHGDGYFDSLSGLLFYLLLGRLFQQKTFDRLAFDRDYKAFFPLSVVRLVQRASGIGDRASAAIPDAGSQRQDARGQSPDEERVALSQLRIGDHLRLRHGELIPADAMLVRGSAVIDYSFVTGESSPVEKAAGEPLFAGGRQTGGTIEVEMRKPVSQGYLASLWDQVIFQKSKENVFATLTNRLAPRFTAAIVAIALGAAAYWTVVAGQPGTAVRAFTAVLIVACPCALALAAPFALGNAQRVLARRGVFLRGPSVVETLAKVDAVAFDKTGTLTSAESGSVRFVARNPVKEEASDSWSLSLEETSWIAELASHSTHPLSVQLAESLRRGAPRSEPSVASFRETPGCGIEGHVDGHAVRLGSQRWIQGGQHSGPSSGSTVDVQIDGAYRGRFVLGSTVRPETDRLLRDLARQGEVSLLSGDNERERDTFRRLFGDDARLCFNRSPLDKLRFIQERQGSGRTVMMVGDGLNDAGALRQSDVGVAVVENVGAFSPASDVILQAGQVPQIDALLRYAKATTRVVRLSFLVSTLYNIGGVAIAASGRLSPVVCAVLMPLSSISVVLFAVGLTGWLGRRSGIKSSSSASSSSSSSALGDEDKALDEDKEKNSVHQPRSSAKAVEGRAREVQSA